MTLLTTLGFRPQKRKNMVTPTHIGYSDISIVIPVRNNQRGIDLFLSEFMKTHTIAMYPKEIIVVDNNSQIPVVLPDVVYNSELNITLLYCSQLGPACARNMGIQYARSQWILFTDSDCIPSSTFLSGYFNAMNGAIGYAGSVRAWGKDMLSLYYETQEILLPTKGYDDERSYPEYIITANALIWRAAIEDINGFNETISIAAGEDIDMGFRLREIGDLSYALNAWVYHNFDDGLLGFIKRFVRYGRGNKIISNLYDLDLMPRVFPAKKLSFVNNLFAKIQYLSLFWGYTSSPMHNVIQNASTDVL